MSRLQTIEDEWHYFARRTMPTGASAVQKTEMRRSFFAGALVALLHATEAEDSDEHVAFLLKECEDHCRQQIADDSRRN